MKNKKETKEEIRERHKKELDDLDNREVEFEGRWFEELYKLLDKHKDELGLEGWGETFSQREISRLYKRDQSSRLLKLIADVSIGEQPEDYTWGLTSKKGKK